MAQKSTPPLGSLSSLLRHLTAWLMGALWRLGWTLSRIIRRTTSSVSLSSTSPLTPLLRVGSTRAGGGGRTTVTTFLARAALRRGYRVALLSYDLRHRTSGTPLRVDATEPWAKWSDDALLLSASGAPVYLSRDFFSAWKSLSASGEYDLLIADGGTEDVRLNSAQTLLIESAEGAPPSSFAHLLPLGKHRSFPDDDRGERVVRLELRGAKPAPELPLDDAILDSLFETLGTVESKRGWKPLTLSLSISVDRPPASPGAEGVLVTGVGDVEGARRLLELAGWKIIALRSARDHSAEVVALAERELGCSCVPLLIAEKDALKLPSELLSQGRIILFGWRLGALDSKS